MLLRTFVFVFVYSPLSSSPSGVDVNAGVGQDGKAHGTVSVEKSGKTKGGADYSASASHTVRQGSKPSTSVNISISKKF